MHVRVLQGGAVGDILRCYAKKLSKGDIHITYNSRINLLLSSNIAGVFVVATIGALAITFNIRV